MAHEIITRIFLRKCGALKRRRKLDIVLEKPFSRKVYFYIDDKLIGSMKIKDVLPLLEGMLRAYKDMHVRVMERDG